MLCMLYLLYYIVIYSKLLHVYVYIQMCYVCTSVQYYEYIYIDGRQPKTRISIFAIVQETKRTNLFGNATLYCA